MSEAPTRQQEMIRVLIADDHALVRQGLCMILEDEPDMSVVGEAGDGAQALKLAMELRPRVLVADVTMPPPDGIELARQLAAELPETRTLIVSMHEDRTIARSALAAGAAGYLVKSSAGLELLEAIRAAAVGQVYVDPKLRAFV